MPNAVEQAFGVFCVVEIIYGSNLVQLSDYIDTLGLTEGYLVIFNHNKKKTWKTEWIEWGEKKIFAVWV